MSSRFRYFLLFAAGVLILAGMASCKAQPEPRDADETLPEGGRPTEGFAY